jgi:hypothetical protein
MCIAGWGTSVAWGVRSDHYARFCIIASNIGATAPIGLLSISEAAKVAGLMRDDIHLAMHNGSLRYQRFAGRRVVDPAVLRDFMRTGGRRDAE